MQVRITGPLPSNFGDVRDWLAKGLRRYAFGDRPLRSYFDNVVDENSRRPFEQISRLVASGAIAASPMRDAARVIMSALEDERGPFGDIVAQLAQIAADLGDKDLPRRLRPRLINGYMIPTDPKTNAPSALFTATEALFKLLPDAQAQRLLKDVSLEPGCPLGLFLSIYSASIQRDADQWVSFAAELIGSVRFASMNLEHQKIQIRNILDDIGHSRFADDVVILVHKLYSIPGAVDLLLSSAFEGEAPFRSLERRAPHYFPPKLSPDLFYEFERKSEFLVGRADDPSFDHLAPLKTRKQMQIASSAVEDFLRGITIVTEIGASSTRRGYSRTENVILSIIDPGQEAL